jgi:hypothetical protein
VSVFDVVAVTCEVVNVTVSVCTHDYVAARVSGVRHDVTSLISECEVSECGWDAFPAKLDAGNS